MKVAIVSDSNSGITQIEAKNLGVTIIPMPFSIEGEEYFEDINLTQEDFYEKLLGDVSVSTSQPSIGYLMDTWDRLLEEYDQVVFIPMSSGLSKTFDTANSLAINEYPDKVFVVNNQRISVTLRQSVLDAKELVSKGYDGKKIKEILESVKFESDIYIMVDTLKYLKKGGRITPTAAAVGGALKIKPILQIKGEKLDKYRMMNRTLENAKRIMIDSAKESINNVLNKDGRTDNVHIAIAYTGTDTKVAYDFVKQIQTEFPDALIVCKPLSLSVSCHIGPGALAIALSKALPENL